MKRIGAPDGSSWSAAATVLDTAENLWNANLTRLSSGRIITPYYKGTSRDNYTGWSIYSDDEGATWSTPASIATAFTRFGVPEGPIVELDNGDLIVALFGQDTGDTRDSIAISRSTDGGDTWVYDIDVVDGDVFGRNMQEPCMVLLANGDLVMMIRSDGSPNRIYQSRSTDDGQTWSTPVAVWDGSGRPAVAQRSGDGAVLCMFRSPNLGATRFRTSYDNAVTWAPDEGNFNGGGVREYMYGQWVELASGQMAAVWSEEVSTTDADLWFSKIANP